MSGRPLAPDEVFAADYRLDTKRRRRISIAFRRAERAGGLRDVGASPECRRRKMRRAFLIEREENEIDIARATAGDRGEKRTVEILYRHHRPDDFPGADNRHRNGHNETRIGWIAEADICGVLQCAADQRRACERVSPRLGIITLRHPDAFGVGDLHPVGAGLLRRFERLVERIAERPLFDQRAERRIADERLGASLQRLGPLGELRRHLLPRRHQRPIH